MKIKKILNNQKKRRRFRVRNKVRGTSDCPRLSVQRTLRHFSCQLIDDSSGKTLASASTFEKSFGGGAGGNADAAGKIGAAIAEKAKSAGVTKVKLDRGSCRYHGRVAAFAVAAREGGLQF